MLSQFRTRYPKGSLASELLAIEHGKYIVKVVVQVEGIILATGLAASDTIEQAEDSARERALVTLNLDSGAIAVDEESPARQQSEKTLKEVVPVHSTEQPATEPTLTESELPPTTQPSVNGGKKVARNSTSMTENLTNQSELLSPPPPAPEPSIPISEKEAEEKPTPQAPVAKEKKDKAAIEADLGLNNHQSSEDSSNVPAVGKTPKTPKNKTSQPQPVEPETPTEPTEPETLLSVEPILEEETPELLEPSQEMPNNDSPSTPSIPPTPSLEQLDFSEIMVRSNAQLKRLGWTTEMGKDYLLKIYGKKSRHLLNDRELLEFLNYLESLPTPPSQE